MAGIDRINTPPSIINSTPQSFEDIISSLRETGDPSLIAKSFILERIEGELNDENREDAIKIISRIQTTNGEYNETEVDTYLVELRTLIGEQQSTVTEVTQTTRDQERAEIEGRFQSIFGEERWEDFRKVWNMEGPEDYNALDRILDLFGEGALVFFDVALDILQAGIIEGGGFALSEMWNGLSFIVENDYRFFVYLAEKENNTLLYLWAYIHANGGLIAYRYMKDYLTTHYGEAINKRFPATTTTRTVEGTDGSTTTEDVEKRHWVQRILGQGYLDAASPATNIFNLSTGASENLSAEQNEYLKRRHTMDILKSFYFDNPSIYRRLIRIENTYMQSNTKTFWRSTHRLMAEHGFVRRIASGILTPEILKREMEGLVISKQQELQRNHNKAMELLFGTSETETGINIDQSKETDFLKGLRFDINSDPQLTPGERAARITALNNYINRITGDTIISEEKLYAELFRIREGNATKIRMLEKIQAELDEVRKGNLIQRAGGAISDLLMRRRANLRRFQQQISDGKWNGRYQEFENHIKAIKSSRVIYRVSDIVQVTRNNEQFKTEMEARIGDVEENEKLYNNDAVDHLRNGIHYIVPDDELEKSMDKILNEFMELKTPYTEIEFFRELERMGNGFLPSNILLQRLEKAKADLERQRPSVESTSRGLLENLRRLGLSTMNIPEIPPTQREGSRRLIQFAMSEVGSGNYRNGIDALGRIPNDVRILLGDAYNDTLRSINIALSARPTVTTGPNINRSNVELERQIGNVEMFMEQARNGIIDIKPGNIASIKDGSLEFDGNADYISEEFTEADRDNYKEQLKGYEGIDQYDFKAGLSGDTSGVQGIEAALEEKYKNELNHLKILSQITGDPNTFAGQLSALSRSLHENNYTRGQVAPIIERLIAGENFADIDTAQIITDTTDHSRGFSGGQEIKDRLQTSFEELDATEKRAIIDFVRNNSIPEDELPENIKRGIERFTSSAEIDGHVSRLNGALNDLETAQNIDDLGDIKTRFDRIIDTNTVIDPEDDEFKAIIERFNQRFGELRTQFSDAATAEMETQRGSEIARHRAELQALLNELNRPDPAGEAAKQRRLERLEATFNDYLTNNGISRTDPEYERLIQDFSDAMDDKISSENQVTRPTTPTTDGTSTETQDTTRIEPGIQDTQNTGDTPRVPQAEIVNIDVEAAQKRAMNALRAAEIEIVLHFDNPITIQEKLTQVRGILRTKANDIPFLQRTVDFRASFAGSIQIPEIRSMQAIGVELGRLRTANAGVDLYASAPALLDAIRNTTDPSALHAIGENIRNLRIAR